MKMVKKILTGSSLVLLMASCSNSTMLFTSLNKGYASRGKKQSVGTIATPEGINYMEDVTISSRNSKTDTRQKKIEKTLEASLIKDIAPVEVKIDVADQAMTTDLQKKYASMLNILPATLSNTSLLKNIDIWYGTRYRYGGTSKSGIDCSAFTREVYHIVYNIDLPRTAHEQYNMMSKINTTDLQEGDLLFFNTTGGVSHVGIYLRNNKFVHSSSSQGVTISDLHDSYYISHYIGAGRVEKDNYVAKNSNSISYQN